MTNRKTTRRALVASVISLILCLSMLMGTTMAWFTDSVTSANNIIKSGTLDVELSYKDLGEADDKYADASEGAIFSYDLWEPGYTTAKVVKIENKGNLAFKYQLNLVPAVADEDAKVDLADVIDVYMFDANATIDRAAIAAATPVGTLADLMADADGAAYGVLLPAKGVGSTDVNTQEDANTPKGEIEYAIVLKMQESAGNEYQNLSVGGGSISVQLLATQYTWENDSFDHMYDEKAEYKTDIPTANVTKMDPATLADLEIPLYTYATFQNTGKIHKGLDAGFTFKATETADEAKASPYRWWHADFVVTFDEPIATGTAGLAGQYDFWSMDWIGFEAFDTHDDGYNGIPANTPCRLLEGKGVYINYEELCRDVKVFNCGVFDNAGANEGTTITVELRLYEVENDDQETGSHNVETGNYITVATYNHTF